MFLYLLCIPLSLHLVYIAVFLVAFPFFGSLWSSLYCRVSFLWVGLDRWLVKASWLVKLVLVFWWVELNFFSLECNLVSSWGFPGGSEGKGSAYNAGDMGSILWMGRSLGEGNGNPLQYSCLENPMDREA